MIDENVESVEKVTENEDESVIINPETSLIEGEKKVECETEKAKVESTFKNELQDILQKLKELPSEAAEIKIPTATKGVKEIYSKLCKALNVSENSTFMIHADNEEMDFSYQCVGYAGIIAVSKALSTCKVVKRINLKYNKLGAESLPAISSLLDQNENITHLNLQSNSFGKGSASILSDLISRCFCVELLDLSNNNLGDEELQEIGIALMKIDSVKELYLHTNDFSSAKAQTFGSCISKCSALLKLDLSCCHLEEGAKFIFGGLKISNLVFLNMARNGIPNDATAALALGLRTNKSLIELNLSYNLISNAGAKTLAPGLKRSSTLEVLNLAHNPIQGSAATSILSSVPGNLKVLDLSGVKVNLAFFKTLRSYAKSGKEVEVVFGSQIRYQYFPWDLTAPDETNLTKSNALSFIEKLAEEKGVSIRSVLKTVHANYIAEQHEASSADQDAKGKDQKKGEKKKKDDEKKKKSEEKEVKNEPKPPGMSVEDFAKGLANSPLALQKVLGLEVGELLSEEGFINMWKLISKVKWNPDDLNIKINVPKKNEGEKPKAKQKKK